jgi:hypothetical protein
MGSQIGEAVLGTILTVLPVEARAVDDRIPRRFLVRRRDSVAPILALAFVPVCYRHWLGDGCGSMPDILCAVPRLYRSHSRWHPGRRRIFRIAGCQETD